MCMGLSLGFLSCSIDLYLFLCQYHTVLMTVALQYSLKSESLIPPAPFFFLKIALAIRGLLCFHTNCKIFLFQFCEKCHWQFDRDCIESVDSLGQYCHFHNIDSSNPRTWYISPSVCIIFNFFIQCLIVFCLQVFCLLRQVYSQVFYSFCCSGKWSVSLISLSDFLSLVYRNARDLDRKSTRLNSSHT